MAFGAVTLTPGTALDRGWIPAFATKCSVVSEQAGRLSRLLAVSLEAGRMVISHESIYRGNDGGWRSYEGLLLETLPASAMSIRGCAVAGNGSPASFIVQRGPLVAPPGTGFPAIREELT